MSQSNSKHSGSNPAESTVHAGAAEQPETTVYEAPRIIHREPLEAVATACTAATAKGNPADCPTGPINS